jgi:DNA-directed RNA polymerase specialized sigma24 family protein
LVRAAQREFVCLKNEGFDDLLQECLIHWFFIKDQYRPEAGASEHTFLNRVTRHKLADLMRIKGANKRKVFYMSESLDAMADDEESISAKEKILMVEEQVVSKLTAARKRMSKTFRCRAGCAIIFRPQSCVSGRSSG